MKKNLALLFLTTSIVAIESPSDTTSGAAVVDWINSAALVEHVEFPYTCNDEIEIGGIPYITEYANYLYLPYLTKESGHNPPGLSFKAQVRDSVLYLVEARICFEKDESHQITERTESEKIPLRIIFPEATNDTIQATFMSLAILLLPDSTHPEGAILVKKGKMIRSWLWADSASAAQNFDAEEFYHFNRYEADSFDSIETDSRNPKFIELMNRLRPYYGEKLWDIAQEMLGNR